MRSVNRFRFVFLTWFPLSPISNPALMSLPGYLMPAVMLWCIDGNHRLEWSRCADRRRSEP